MYGALWFLIGLAAGISLGGLAALVWALFALRRRVKKLEKRLVEMEPSTRRDLAARAYLNIGEQFLFDLASLREETDALTNKLEYFSQRAAHVASGGSPDDPPTKWKANGNKPETSGGNEGKK